MKIHEIPSSSTDVYGWHRRFTSLVEQNIAMPSGKTPSEAGKIAKEIIIEEFKLNFPNDSPLEFML